MASKATRLIMPADKNYSYSDGDQYFEWSPDSKWLVFNTQTCSGSCQQYNAVQTRLRLVKAIDDVGQPVSGGAPIDLLAGTHQPNSSNNWPKFAPFLSVLPSGDPCISLRL